MTDLRDPKDRRIAELADEISNLRAKVERGLALAEHWTGLAIENDGQAAAMYRSVADRIREALR